MPSNLPRNTGGRGGLEPQIKPNQFPANLDLIRKDTEPEHVIFENSGAATSRPYSVAPCEYWTIYVYGTTPDVDIQATMNPRDGLWVTLNNDGLGNAGFYEGSGGQHPWIRAVINSGSNVTVHLFRKYATY